MGELVIKPAILVRMGELTLKGRNRSSFVSQLFEDIKHRLLPFDCAIKLGYDRIFISDYGSNEQELVEAIKLVQGVHSLSVCLTVPSSFENFVTPAVQAMAPFANQRFKIECRRSDKSFPIDSHEVAKQLAPLIVRQVPLQVDVKNPDVTLYIEIRKGLTYFFTEVIYAEGGLPSGSGGKVLVLISGGIDSPVAAHQIARRGQTVDYVTFVTPLTTSPQSLQKTVDLVLRLRHVTGQKSRLFVCDFTPLQQELTHIRYENYRIVCMRRYFLRIAERLAHKTGAQALVTGEALGQVASQTLEAMDVIQKATDMLVLRPLLSLDKAQIITLAKQIGTYETSIQPFADACESFAPLNPVTKPSLKKAELCESDVALAEELVSLVVAKATTFGFGPPRAERAQGNIIKAR